MTTVYKQHKLSMIYPRMDDTTFRSLCTSIQTHGFDPTHAIVLYENKVLDGWHRYKACGVLDTEPKFRSFDGDVHAAVQFVQRENFDRRDLSSSDRAYITASMTEFVDSVIADSKTRQGGGQTDLELVNQLTNEDADSNDKRTDSILASEMGTNRQYVSDARKLMRDSPDVFDAAKELKISIPEAKNIAKLKPITQTKVIEEIKASPKTPIKKVIHAAKMDAIKTDIASQSNGTSCGATIDYRSYINWLPHQPTCDLLLTDPPYTTDVDDIVSFANDWLPMALAKVKSTGRAYVFIGAYPDEIAAYLDAAKQSDMTLANILVWTYRNTIGPAPTTDYKLNWQAILYFRGNDAPPLNAPMLTEQFTVQDINAPDGRFGDGRYHKWQKPDELAERIIRHSTSKDDVVLDCFAGTGTFMLAAARLGRHPIGCDIDPEILKIAVDRGCAVNGI